MSLSEMEDILRSNGQQCVQLDPIEEMVVVFDR